MTESDRIEMEFKNNLFVSNPPLFQELYQDPKEEEFEIEEFAPQTQEDLDKMLAQLKREGVIK